MSTTNQVKELYAKYKLIVYPLTLTLAGLVLIILVIIPQIKLFIDSQATLNSEQARTKTLEVKAQELSSINPDDLTQKLTVAIAALPTDKDYGSIIGLIQRIAANSNVTISSLTLAPIAGEKTPGFAVNVDVLGLKPSIDQMISSIDQSSRVMKVASIDISSSKASTIEAGLIINVFYAPAPAALGSVDSELPKLSAQDEAILATLASSQTTTPSNVSQLLPRGKANPFQ